MGRAIGSIKTYVHLLNDIMQASISNKYLILYSSMFNFPVLNYDLLQKL